MRTVYIELSSKLAEYLQQQQITDRLPGVHKLAQALGVNHITLTKAMRELERQGVLTIVPAKGTFVNHSRSSRPRFKTIGIVGISAGIVLQQPMATFLSSLAASYGYKSIFINFDAELFKFNRNLLSNFPVDGFIFRYSTLRKEQLNLLRQEHIPFVSCAYLRDMIGQIDQADCDHEQGHTRLIQYFQQRGCKRIAYLDFDRTEEYRPYHERVRSIYSSKLGSDFVEELYYAKGIWNKYYENYGAHCREQHSREACAYLERQPHRPDAIIALAPNHELERYCAMHNIELGVVQYGHIPETSTCPRIYFEEKKILSWAMKRVVSRLSGENPPPELYLEPGILIANETKGTA